MSIIRRVVWEYEREYNSLREAKKDEDNFLRETMCKNAELVDNELIEGMM